MDDLHEVKNLLLLIKITIDDIPKELLWRNPELFLPALSSCLNRKEFKQYLNRLDSHIHAVQNSLNQIQEISSTDEWWSKCLKTRNYMKK